MASVVKNTEQHRQPLTFIIFCPFADKIKDLSVIKDGRKSLEGTGQLGKVSYPSDTSMILLSLLTPYSEGYCL